MTMLRVRAIGLWILRILVAFVFVMAGSHKLMGDPMMVDMFGRIGVGQWFRYVTGTIELVAALLILWPRTSFWGTVLTLPVLAGAFVTQAAVLYGDVIHVVVIAAFVALLAWLQRPDASRAAAAGAL